MNYVPSVFQRVINPWQTKSEIKRACKYISVMLKCTWTDSSISFPTDELAEEGIRLLRLNEPERKW